MSMRGVIVWYSQPVRFVRLDGSPLIADFRCWTWPEVAILGAEQKERDPWGREWVYGNYLMKTHFTVNFYILLPVRKQGVRS